MTTLHETLISSALTRADLIEAIRKAVGSHLGIDLNGSVLASETTGSTESESTYLQWVHAGNSEVIALQGLDKGSGHLWEFSTALLPGDRWAISRRSVHRPNSPSNSPCLLDSLWAVAAGSKSCTPHQAAQSPDFITLAAAALAPGGLTAIKDQTQQLADARHDVDYWRDLARTQDRMLRERPAPVIVSPGAAAEGAEPVVATAFTSLKNLDQWAALNTDRIIILQRAISAAKRSPYENPPLVYECLELLANEYRRTKLGELDRNAFKEKCTSMGLDFGGSVDPTRAGVHGDDYFFRWGGKKMHLDQHLGKSTARDPRFILRIYYTWSDEDGKPIVGWLPSHLGNSKT